MILTVTIGNTVTKLGLFEGDELKATWEVATPQSITTSEVHTTLMNFGQAMNLRKKIHFQQPMGSIIASVVPNITEKWVAALTSALRRKPLIVGPGLKTGIRLGYSDPAEIGADRIADMVAGRALYGYPLVVINMEAAVTFEVIDKKGEFAGGIIAPGLESAARELSNTAAKIPVIDLQTPSSVIAKSTQEAVQAGIVMGEVARIDGLIGMIWDELGYRTQVIAAGLRARLVQKLSHNISEYAEHLTLQGLNLLYQLNTRS